MRHNLPKTAAVATLLAALLFCRLAPAAPFVRGDVDSSGSLTITDPIRILGYLFLGSPAELNCEDAADVNDDAKLSITDGIYLLSYLFIGGPPPADPYPACGADTTPDEMECVAFGACIGSPTAAFTAAPAGGEAPVEVTFDASGSSDPNGSIVSYAWSFGDAQTGSGVLVSHRYEQAGVYTVTLVVADDQGLEGSATRSISVTGPTLPPDPGSVAPPIDPTVATTLFDATKFLYSGESPIQTGVAPGAIEPRRAAVLRGMVKNRDGAPIGGASIAVLHHPELGQTLTRADGMFDLAVNGGGTLHVDYVKPGYCHVQRQLAVPWSDFAVLPDVILVPLDPRVTTVSLLSNEEVQVARGSVMDDADGTRCASLFFFRGTQAEMVLPDGSTAGLDVLDVRATEFTVGEGGPASMPAELPATSGYTYAVELSVDQALEAGATRVRFSKPVIFYLENFLDFPVGGTVPTGHYDRDAAAWVPADNGRVVKLLGVAGGLATLDSDGDGAPDSFAQLAAIGITDAERARLPSVYPEGASLWRVPVLHFSPWDHNWPRKCRTNCGQPNEPSPQQNSTSDNNRQCGSIIEVENQVLEEELELADVPFRLFYSSERVPGRAAASTLKIFMTGATLPADLIRIDLVIDVGGKRYCEQLSAGPCGELSPPATNASHVFTWDGLDAYGRKLQGRQPYRIAIGYVYEAVYTTPEQIPQSFSASGEETLTANRERNEITAWQEFRGWLGIWDARGQGLGGWTLEAHHAYDPGSKVLYLGDGESRKAETIGNVIETVAGGSPSGATIGDGGPATAARLALPLAVAIGPDGTLYISEPAAGRIRRVDPDGTIWTHAGTTPGYGGDGGPAAQAQMRDPSSLALGPDGSLYISDWSNYRIRRIGPDGIITTFAGTGTRGFAGDNGPAAEAQINAPEGIAVAPDGSVYLADSANGRIRRIRPGGIITTVAGTGLVLTSGDGGPARTADLLHPAGLAVAPDGTVYLCEGVSLVRRITPDGIISKVAGGFPRGYGGDGMPAVDAKLDVPRGLAFGPDGSLFIVDNLNYRVRQVSPSGIITTLAGTGKVGYSGDGGLAAAAQINAGGPNDTSGAAVGPDGSVYLVDRINQRVRRIGSARKGLTTGDVLIPSVDGTEVYLFRSDGRHLRTLAGLTGAVRHQFSYDAEGRLESITDGYGNVTSIERLPGGMPAAIIGPYGARNTLAVNADGYLSRVTGPSQASVTLAYAAGGLLTSLTDRGGGVHRFFFDSAGRLTRDQNPDGASSTLERTESGTGFAVSFRTAAGRTTTYEVERLPGGEERRATIDPAGDRIETLTSASGAQTTTYADGTTTAIVWGPDPRWRMEAPVLQKLTLRLPSELTQTVEEVRTVLLANVVDPLSLQKLTDQFAVNGRIYKTEYDAVAGTLTETTPAGRIRVTAIDVNERPVRVVEAPGIEPIIYSRDARGRVIEKHQGPLSSTFGYDADGRLVSLTNAAGEVLRLSFDGTGDITEAVSPAGRVYGFTRDAAGDVTSLVPPGGGPQGFAFTAARQLVRHSLPSGASTEWGLDLDGQITMLTLPGGRVVSFTYGGDGRLQSAEYAGATVSYSYMAGGRLNELSRTPAGGGLAQETQYLHDGTLRSGEDWIGTLTGTLRLTHDANFFLTDRTVSFGGPSVSTSYEYDADGLAVTQGPFAITRNGPRGGPTLIADAASSCTIAHDALGRVSSRKLVVNGAILHEMTLTYGSSGRLSRKVETAGGATRTFDYAYDADGWLIQVAAGGATAESYVYDPHGNRTSRRLGSGPVQAATYDGDDRLLQSGNVAYNFDTAGFLLKRGEDTFEYSSRGELLRATVAGKTVTYAYDGLARMVARTDASGTTLYAYGDPDNALRVTASRDPAGSVIVLYHDDDGFVFALEKSGTRYYVGVDAAGSPRVVSDASGAAVKVLEYDAFGNVASDSSPSFRIPVGFAGGLPDPVTGLVRFGWRDYDPAAGRWTSRDPILFGGGQLNLFAYAGNDPVNHRDPDGLQGTGRQLADYDQQQQQKNQSQEKCPLPKPKISKNNKAMKDYEKLLKESSKRADDSAKPQGDQVKRTTDGINNGLNGNY